MIAKHIPINTLKKSNYSNLVNYLVDTQNKEHRVGTIRVSNCYSDLPDSAVVEVLNIQQMNKTAASDKTYHLVVSFRDEILPDDTLQEIENVICAGLGFSEHQRISVMHMDTDHPHMHIAINKIHPDTLRIHNPHYDYKTIGELCEAIEKKYGLSIDNHDVKQRGAQNRSTNIEFKAGSESLIGWIKQECFAELEKAKHWNEFNQILKDHGLELRERGNGFVFVSNNGIGVKASSVDRSLSKKNLVLRFGEFIPPHQDSAIGSTTTKKHYEKTPKKLLDAKIDTTELYSKYKAQKDRSTLEYKQRWAIARSKRDQLIEDAKKGANNKRILIKALAATGLGKMIMYKAVHQSFLKKVDAIKNEYKKESAALKESNQKLTWLDFLSKEARLGNHQALDILRARSNKEHYRNSIHGMSRPEQGDPLKPYESVTKNGTTIQGMGSSGIREDEKRIVILEHVPENELLDILRYAKNKYGNKIIVNGTESFKDRVLKVVIDNKLDVTFDDPKLEKIKQKLASPKTAHKSPRKGRSR